MTQAVAERIRQIVAEAVSNLVIICGEGGVILACATKERVGTVHEGAARILRGEVEEIAIREADVAHMQGVKRAGYSCAIHYQGRRIGSITIAGEPDMVKGTARLAARVVAVELGVLEQKQRIRHEVWAGLENASAGAEQILAGTEQHRNLASSLEKATADLQQRGRAASQALQLISDLAQRANLLGLNAAVEAAHAGRQGAGFTVVADEIRRLADRTKTSAAEINAALSAWQKSFEYVASSVTESGQISREQAEAIREVTMEIQRIQAAVATLTE